MNKTKRILCMALTIIMLCTTLVIPTFAAGNIMYGIGFVDASGLRLRSQPSTNSNVLDVAYDNDCVVIIGQSGDWYHVNYNLQEGYMHKDYLDVLTVENAELGYGEVTGSAVNMRSGPSTAHNVLTVASYGDKCYIIGLNQGWYKVIYNSYTCYIRSDYLKLTEYPYENVDSPNTPKYFRGGKSIGTLPSSGSNGNGYNSWDTPSPDNNSSWSEGSSISGQAIVNEAKKYLGIPYVYGGASPSGFDCSGLTYYVLKTLGYSPARTPEGQYSHGIAVSYNELMPGDLVFFSSNGSTITHVGIYAGNGEFIHAPNSRSTVSYADMTSGYWYNNYYGARRIAE